MILPTYFSLNNISAIEVKWGRDWWRRFRERKQHIQRTRTEARGLKNNQEERACLENHAQNLALYPKCNGSYVEKETQVSEILQTELITFPSRSVLSLVFFVNVSITTHELPSLIHIEFMTTPYCSNTLRLVSACYPISQSRTALPGLLYPSGESTRTVCSRVSTRETRMLHTQDCLLNRGDVYQLSPSRLGVGVVSSQVSGRARPQLSPQPFLPRPYFEHHFSVIRTQPYGRCRMYFVPWWPPCCWYEPRPHQILP